MNTIRTNSTAFGNFHFSENSSITNPKYQNLCKSWRQNRNTLEYSTKGVFCKATPHLTLKGNFIGMNVTTKAINGTGTQKHSFIEFIDFLKGKKSKFSKFIPAEELSLEILKKTVKRTSKNYRKRFRIFA